MRRALVPLLLVAGVVGYVVWARPDAPVPPPPAPKEVVLQYADGSKMWSSMEGGPRNLIVKRVLAELAEASVPYDSLVGAGAVVRTTIDAKAQAGAAAVIGRLVGPQKRLDASVTAIDPASGAVRVYLPGFRYVHDLAGGVTKEPGPGLMLVSTQNAVQTRVTPLEVSATYATFAAGGVQHKPHLVANVTAADGSPRYRAAKEVELAFSKEAADEFTARLKGNPACNGAACASSTYSSPTEPGKILHAWMAGYTPQLAVTVLVGQADVPYNDDLPEVNLDAELPGVIWRELLVAG